MKSKHAFLLILAIVSGCSQQDAREHIGDSEQSTELLTHKELEKTIWDYFLLIEKDVKKDLGVSDTEVIERVQLMIDEGYVKEPAILIVTADGPRWETVRYATYKALMERDAVESRRFHGTQPNLDSSRIDSIRSNLLDALRENAVYFDSRGTSKSQGIK